MKTQRRLAETLKDMMATTPIDSISVTTLSKKCGINRQTFYYHFHDVYDLLTLVFLNEKVEKLDKEINPHNLFVSLYNYYEKNTGIILKANVKPPFLLLIHGCFRFTQKIPKR